MNNTNNHIPDSPDQWDQYARMLQDLPTAAPPANAQAEFRARLDATGSTGGARSIFARRFMIPSAALATILLVCFSIFSGIGTGNSGDSNATLNPDAGKRESKLRRPSSRRTVTPPVAIPEPEIASPPETFYMPPAMDSVPFNTPRSSVGLDDQFAQEPSPGPGPRRFQGTPVPEIIQ